MTRLRIIRAGALATLQDAGRFGYLAHGIGASGPMDRSAFSAAAYMTGGAGPVGIEFTTAGLELEVEDGACTLGLAGGEFSATVNGKAIAWPGACDLATGDRLTITAGPTGNFGYVRFHGNIEMGRVLNSASTNSRIGLGGAQLSAGDALEVRSAAETERGIAPQQVEDGPIRVIWGLHAEQFSPDVRTAFVTEAFEMTSQMDRMGMRLRDPSGVFASAPNLNLVSDAIVDGDIQILGDGTPTVLMRDHQPTGGYPRIATVIGSDQDRLAQLRPGTKVMFSPITVEHAQTLLRRGY
ncbi:allophanate hydrolase [Devosia pacifica]|uniref:Allophanate hydrolase n=1 Tax=Devosia pacifica TaxID=1335967 RepID=A0A918VLR3_9HYPH|nr:biotin-dependent carboxyltransferase family protein [Devosia pacifica]GHA11539.1 allophanate hydrolase [Devosia pacifica]